MYTMRTPERLAAWRKFPAGANAGYGRLAPRWFRQAHPATPTHDERGTLWHYGEGIGGDIERSRPGLRFVGYADHVELHHIHHTGWHSDAGGDSLCRGVVYQLPGKDGQARYIAGYEWGDTGARGSFDAGGGTLFMDEIFTDEDRGSYVSDGARQAAQMADEHARVAAESAREESEAEAEAEREAEETEAETIRGKARNLISDAAWLRDRGPDCIEIYCDGSVDTDAEGGAWVEAYVWVPEE